MSFYKRCQEKIKELPEGYDVVIRCAPDGWVVELETPDGTQSVTNNGDLIGDVYTAVQQAKEDAGQSKEG